MTPRPRSVVFAAAILLLVLLVLLTMAVLTYAALPVLLKLLADGVRRVVCAGTRAPEMALRLKYAGWPQDSIEVVEPIEQSLDEAVAAAPERLFALPTYTALLEMRTLLTHRGLAPDYWQ